MQRINFLGCPVDNVSMQEALDWAAHRIDTQQDGTTITALNANKLWQMSKNKRLNRFVHNSGLVISEWAVVWGTRQLGTPIKAHVSGITLLKAMLPWAEQQGYRPFFLGAKPQVVELLAQQVQKDYPKIELAGWHHGYLKSPADQDQISHLIQQSQPDLLFVAMGTPKQEFWIEEHSAKLQVPIMMGVGGSFDVIAGLKQDTPDWARGKGLEWLYRLSLEPHAYWRRYLTTNPWFVLQVLKASFAK